MMIKPRCCVVLPFFSNLIKLIVFRSIFIWRPKEESELVEQKDERKIIVCGKADKKQSRKFGDDSEDSDDDISKLKHKNVKSKKFAIELTPYSRKGKR